MQKEDTAMFHIVTDTPANLPTSFLRREQITLIPFTFHSGNAEESCPDLAAFDAKAFYARIRSGEKLTTSQIPPQRFVEEFTPILARGEDILFVSLSSGVSGSYASSCIAAAQLREEFPERRIFLFDSFGASLGEGLFALYAAHFRAQGLDAETTYEKLVELRPRMAQIFTVGDLRHLKRTGRLSNLEAAVGTVLQIKPLLVGNPEGKIVTFSKLRGRRRAIEAIAKLYDERVWKPEEQIIGLSHADCLEDAQLLASMLRNGAHPPKDIWLVDHEPVTGTHVGPEMLALFFLADADVRML